MQHFKTLARLCHLAGLFESYLVANPKDRFSRGMAHYFLSLLVMGSEGLYP